MTNNYKYSSSKKTLIKISSIFAILLFFFSFSQPFDTAADGTMQETVKPEGEGSKESLKETPFVFSDPMTGNSVTVFESINNGAYEKDKRYSKLKYYLPPLFHFKTLKDLPSPITKKDRLIYTFPVLHYHPKMFTNAVEVINDGLKDITGGGFKISSSQVSHMTHQMVSFLIPLLPEAEIVPRGDLGIDFRENDYSNLEISVPIENKNTFEQLVTNSGLNIRATIHYNALNILKKEIIWTVEHVQKSDAYKDLQSGGSNFVNANQIERVVKGAVTRAGVYQYEDPGINGAIDNAYQKLLEDFLKLANEKTISNIIDAERLDDELRKGTGLTPNEFKPITLMYEMTEKIKDVKDYKTANTDIQSFYNENHTSFDVSASVGWGPFSASVGYKKDTTDIKTGFFKNQKEFTDFQDKYIERRGPDVKIIPRGIKLLEKSQFIANITLASSSVLVRPVAEVKRFAIESSLQVGKNNLGLTFPEVGEIIKDIEELKKNTKGIIEKKDTDVKVIELEDDFMVGNNLRAFIETGSTSTSILVSFNEGKSWVKPNTKAPNDVIATTISGGMRPGEYSPTGKAGVLITVRLNRPVDKSKDGIYVKVSLYQQGANYYKDPILYKGD